MVKIKELFPIPKKKDFVLLNIGLLFTAAGIVFFKAPNNFAMGGTSGLSILLAAIVPGLNVGTFMFIINMALVGWGYIALGKGFGGSTVYSSVVLSVFTWALEFLFPLTRPLTDDTFLEMTWAVLLPAIGSALVFNAGSSTGGTDIVAMVMSKRTNMEVGKALLASDLLITIGAGFVFGIPTLLYCALGTVIKGLLVDNLIESFNIRKRISIVTCKPDEVKKFILEELHRGANVYYGEGAYTGERHEVIETVVTRRQAGALRNYLKSIDPKAFMTIVNTSETIGKGFRSFD